MIGIGSVVNGKYELSRLLGDGGMGSVYEARHAVLGTRVAIKVLHPELAKRPGLVERFLQEARVAAQIRSSHVVQVTDVDRTPEGHAYIVMELLEGEPLSSVLDRQHKLPVPTACEYALQILEALEAAHALGVIHRDLKPENVFVTFVAGKPVLKLIDFGIAKARRTDAQKNLTVAGVLMGTAEYMAPEQARSAGEVDARADLYGAGVMLYEMIAGSRPIQGDDARIIALRVERGEVIPLVQAAPDVPRDIAGLVHRAMAARPELRFSTATEMRLALEKAATGKRPATYGGVAVPVGGPAASMPPVEPAAAPRHPTPVAAGSNPGSDPDRPVDTQRAPPMGGGTAIGPSPASPPMASPMGPHGAYAGVAIPPPQPAPARRSGSPGRTLAMIALPVLIGVGVVLVLVATGKWSPGSENPPPPPSTTSTTTAATATTDDSNGGLTAPPTVATVTPTGPGTIPTLAPTGRLPPTGPGTHPSAHPGVHPSARPHPSESAQPVPTGPPPLFPSTLPFPLPTGFPTLFPPWPGTPPPQPGPAQAAPGNSGSI
ncbi:MAG TPA: protein kinase [Polyangiaceae bacterium]